MFVAASPETPMLYNVLAIDPGGTTGWSYVRWAELVPGKGFAEGELDIVSHQVGPHTGKPGHDKHTRLAEDENAQVSFLEKLYIKLALRDGRVNVIVEDFILRIFDASRDVLSPVRITAGLSYALSKFHVKGVGAQLDCSQSASMAMSTIQDDYLKLLGYFMPGAVHANDSLRHLLVALRRIESQKQT